MFYSKKTGGFYDAEIHGDLIPPDAVEISAEEHAALFAAQSDGKVIRARPDGYPEAVDPPAPTIEAIWQQIKAKRDELQQAGCLVAGHWFHNDVKSRTQWERMANKTQLLLAAGASASDAYLIGGQPVSWKTMQGNFVPLTLGLILQTVDAFEIQEALIFKAAETHRAQMAASPDPAAYDYSTGWPQVFQG